VPLIQENACPPVRVNQCCSPILPPDSQMRSLALGWLDPHQASAQERGDRSASATGMERTDLKAISFASLGQGAAMVCLMRWECRSRQPSEK